MPVRPNFFIVGAPKAGTTTLFRYLAEHPDVFVSSRKEPHHFASDLESPAFIRDREEYLDLFREGGASSRAGEASTMYLLSERAAGEIRAFAPEARVVIMLRNPTDLVYSYHSQRLYNGREDIEAFGEALAAEPERRRGLRIPANGQPVQALQYRQVGRLGAQVGRYVEAFPPDQLCFVVFEDFARDRRGVYARVCAFLGIDPSHEPQWEIHNANARVRSSWVRDLLRFSPAVKRVARAVLPRPLRRWIGTGVATLNTAQVARPPLPTALRRELALEFADDVRQLSGLVGRDLTGWTASDLERTS